MLVSWLNYSSSFYMALPEYQLPQTETFWTSVHVARQSLGCTREVLERQEESFLRHWRSLGRFVSGRHTKV